MRTTGSRLRILVVNWQDRTNPNAGGAEIHLHEIFGRLARGGHRVALLCSGWPGAARRETVDGIDVHRVGGRYTFALHARRAFRDLGADAFDVIVEDINKLPLFTPTWADVPTVAIVPHLFGTTAFRQESAPVAGLVWLAETRMPNVYAESPVLVISESTRDDLVARGFDASRIVVSYPGIDHDTCRVGPGGVGRDRSPDPLLVYVGRLQRYKSVDVVLRALAALPGTGPSVRMVIAGRGSDRRRLERLRRGLGLGDRVEFAGHVSDADKASLFRRAWANVYPSPKEGWGITNIEAAACGTPSLAADSPGLRESVVDGSTGRLIPYGDVQAWSREIGALAADPDWCESLGATAARHAAQFTWERTAAETEELIRSAI